jgi:hypothetical protein
MKTTGRTPDTEHQTLRATSRVSSNRALRSLITLNEWDVKIGLFTLSTLIEKLDFVGQCLSQPDSSNQSFPITVRHLSILSSSCASRFRIARVPNYSLRDLIISSHGMLVYVHHNGSSLAISAMLISPQAHPWKQSTHFFGLARGRGRWSFLTNPTMTETFSKTPRTNSQSPPCNNSSSDHVVGQGSVSAHHQIPGKSTSNTTFQGSSISKQFCKLHATTQVAMLISVVPSSRKVTILVWA